MSTSDLTQYMNYILLAVLVLIAVLAVFGAIRRSKPEAARRDLLQGIVAVIVVVAMGFISSATSWAWVGVLLVVGLVIGLLLGGIRPLVAWIIALTTIYFAMGLLFDKGGSFAPALGMLALGAGASLGQGIRGKVRTDGAAKAGAAKTAETPQGV